MARYEFCCDACQIRWHEQASMDEISDLVVTCPECEGEAVRIFSAGMIRVRGGASPARYSDGSYQTVTKGRDPGLRREIEQIWGDHAPADPNTGEKYQVFDDDDGTGPYTALPSQRENMKQAALEAERRGTAPTLKQQDRARYAFYDRAIARAEKKLRNKPAKDKGRRT